MDETLLKRTIKNGSKYNKYFGSQCGKTFLGNGNTDLSISIMAKWVNKYKHQVKQLALNEFANLDLETTITEIYNFAHDYFQYKLDGLDQQIRSPYCSWIERQSGIDCKSYTVLVSCILSNLGIVHYLTKTKQPGYAPESFSHVYVRIPKNQKTKKLQDGYYIIDPTIHTNYELPFLEAKDKIMSNVGNPHYGLGYAQTGVQDAACKCTDHNSSLGFGATTHQEANYFPTIALGAADTQTETNGLDQYLDDIDSDGWFNSTFGSVFNNGWNLSCWGSSYNPEQAKQVAQQKMQANLPLLTNKPTQATFNRFLNNIVIEIGSASTSSAQSNLAQCTREAYALEKTLLQEFLSNTLAIIRQAGYKLTVSAQNNLPSTQNQTVQNWINQNQVHFRYTSYTLTPPINGTGVITMPNTNTGNSNNENTGVIDYTPGINPNNNSSNGSGGYTPPKTEKAGVGMVLGTLTIAALAAKYFMDKNKKAKAKK